MMDIEIRRVREEDLAEVAQIQVDGWRTTYKGIIDDEYLSTLDVSEKLQKLRLNYDKNGFIVAESGERVVGFCRYVNDGSFTQNINEIDCEVTALYVEPSLKGNGIGAKLFEEVIEDFKELGRKKMIVWCFEKNQQGRNFYEKMGGRAVAKKVSMIGGKEYTEVGLVYDL